MTGEIELRGQTTEGNAQPVIPPAALFMMMAGLAKAAGVKNVPTAHNKAMSEGRKVLFMMMEMIFGFIFICIIA